MSRKKYLQTILRCQEAKTALYDVIWGMRYETDHVNWFHCFCLAVYPPLLNIKCWNINILNEILGLRLHIFCTVFYTVWVNVCFIDTYSIDYRSSVLYVLAGNHLFNGFSISKHYSYVVFRVVLMPYKGEVCTFI